MPDSPLESFKAYSDAQIRWAQTLGEVALKRAEALRQEVLCENDAAVSAVKREVLGQMRAANFQLMKQAQEHRAEAHMLAMKASDLGRLLFGKPLASTTLTAMSYAALRWFLIRFPAAGMLMLKPYGGTETVGGLIRLMEGDLAVPELGSSAYEAFAEVIAAIAEVGNKKAAENETAIEKANAGYYAEYPPEKLLSLATAPLCGAKYW
jgi:hypothetical protein